jgi:A/G-specific adenine glycosylase
LKVKESLPDPKRIRRKLLRWYDKNQRSLPWRETRDPYAIWVSETMLQQTQVKTVIPYYLRFLEKFPTAEALARAPLGSVLKVWENLGYYARARSLHKAAGEVVRRHGGRIPQTLEDLLDLPGIGRYTAGAILSTALDGNVRRVMSRLFGIMASVDDEETRERIEMLVQPLIPKRDPGRFNQALMELGALCCTPKSPKCPDCSFQDDCRAWALGLAERLPVRGRKKTVPHREVVAAVIRDRKGRLLIVQRPARGLLGLLWKFPGGIVGPHETREEGLKRIVREELGARIDVGPVLDEVKHAYTHFRITLTAYSCRRLKGSPAGSGWHWADAGELEALPFSAADRKIARAVTRPVT